MAGDSERVLRYMGGRHKQGQQMEQCGTAPISQLILNSVTR